MSRHDAEVKDDVLLELEWEPGVREEAIGVTVHEGTVTLMGKVSAYFEKQAAVTAAKRVAGVRAVADEIEVWLPEDMVGTDEDIAHRIARIFEWNAQIPQDGIRAEVSEGVVTLTGEVDWNFQRDEAERQVERLIGVVSVFNEIGIRDRTSPDDVKGRIVETLHRYADLEASRLHVSSEDGTVTLSGEVGNFDEMDKIEEAAWAVPGVKMVVNQLTVR